MSLIRVSKFFCKIQKWFIALNFSLTTNSSNSHLHNSFKQPMKKIQLVHTNQMIINLIFENAWSLSYAPHLPTSLLSINMMTGLKKEMVSKQKFDKDRFYF